MLHNPSRMAVFLDNPTNLVGKLTVQDHLFQSSLRAGRLQEIGQFAAGATDRHRRTYAAAFLRIVDHGPKLFGELAVSEPRLVGSDLHRDGKEPVVVAIHMRLQQRLDLLSTGHESTSGSL